MKCPVCSIEAANVSPWGPLMRVTCPRCGTFALARSLFDDLPGYFQQHPFHASEMSHSLRRMQREDNTQITVLPEALSSYFGREKLPSPREQATELILWIGDHQPSPSTFATASELLLEAWIGSALPATPGGAPGLRWLVAQLEPTEHQPRLFLHNVNGGFWRFQLTMAGWEEYEKLKQVRTDSRTAFMAMKFGDAELNGVVDQCFRPAVKRTGFELRILTDHQRAGLIDDQIRAALISARFVVADLTHGSFGAYWEAGFADGRGLPVIYTCKRAEWQKAKTHFDTNHMTTVIWDPSELKSSEDEMTAIIRATLRAEATQSDA
jgi:hypothetical protein